MKNKIQDELISFVKKSSDTDNFIIAAFIAGMQSKNASLLNSDNQPRKPPENKTA